MSDIKANIPGLDTHAQNFAASASQLADLISQVSKDMKDLQGEWQGPAASQFIDLMTQWNHDVQSIQHVLDQVGQKLKSAGIDYQDLEARLMKGFQVVY